MRLEVEGVRYCSGGLYLRIIAQPGAISGLLEAEFRKTYVEPMKVLCPATPFLASLRQLRLVVLRHLREFPFNGFARAFTPSRRLLPRVAAVAQGTLGLTKNTVGAVLGENVPSEQREA